MRYISILILSVILTSFLSFGQVTQLRSPDCNRTNTTLTKVLYAANATADTYRFRVLNVTTGIIDSIENSSRSFFLNQLPLISRYNCVYDVDVCMSFDGGTSFGLYGGVCNPESVALTTQLRSSDCGRSLTSVLQTVYASLSTADSWDFEVRNVNDPASTEIVNRPSRSFNLGMTVDVDFQLLNQEYEIRVRTTQGGVVQPWGSWCSLFTPAITTKLRPSDCGRTLTQINFPLYAQVNSADSYEFEIENVSFPGTSDIYPTPTREFRLTFADPQYQLYGTEYRIRVRGIYDGVTMPFGDWCSIFTPPSVGPDVIEGCGNTFEYLAYEYVTCTDLLSATQYQWLLRIGASVVDTLYTTTNEARLGDFLDGSNQPSYDYGQTYSIAARALIGGVWTPYGSGCLITTTTNAHTEVQHLCSAQLNSFNTPISVFAIFSATAYEFEVTDLTGGDGTQIVTKSERSIKLNELTAYSYGHEYSIRCRVTFKGIVYPYSTACSVTAPQPVTTLRPSDCPRLLTTMNKKLYANPLIFDEPAGLDPVESYRFKIGGNVSVWKSTRDITLIEILGSAPAASTPYTIQVQAKYDGVEQIYGSGCTVTTPSSIILNDEGYDEINSQEIAASDFVNIYPNPARDYFTIVPVKHSTNDPINIEIHDINGRLIESVKYNSQLTALSELEMGRNIPNGVYFIYVMQSNRVVEVHKVKKI